MKASSIFWHLGWMLLCAVALSPLLFGWIRQTALPAQPDTPAELPLAAAAAAPVQPAAPELPLWMIAIVICFTLVQLYTVMRAARLAKKPVLNAADIRQISFLCETPMYLGLLGSLFGVCMTQFLSGSLSAPLAYLTTIVGIMLYLYARFTVLLQLHMPTQLTHDLTMHQ